MMLWFYFMALILLIGFELNASIWSAQSQANAINASKNPEGNGPLMEENQENGKI
jgi:uncharacterized BrkB/YihY/UPF0761 family membrane protein